MKTNCELPIGMLEKNDELNQYDFILYHLLRDNPKYRRWAYNQRLKKKRLMILDNSAYEFYIKGEKLDMDAFAHELVKFEPDYYILPDKIMDKEYTMKKTEGFIDFYGPFIDTFTTTIKPKPMAIMQGMCEDDLLECANKYIELGIDCVGVPFHQDFYLNMEIDADIVNVFMDEYDELTIDIKYAMGRVQFVRNNHDMLNKFNHVHFLGSHCPLEKEFYSGFQTMDTGYPVKLGIECIKLGEEKSKPTTIIDDFLEADLTEEQQKTIIYNINKFKSL